jgi:hypothetical protein
MNYELLTAFAAISRLSNEWQPDQRPHATLRPLAQRGRRHRDPTLPVVANRLLRERSER